MRLAAAGSAASLLLGVALLARSWSGLVACLVLGGLANAVSHPAANLAGAGGPCRGQGLSFGIKQAAIPVATLLAGLAVPTIAVTLGWRWAFAGGAALALAVAFLVPASTRRSIVRRSGVKGDKDARTGPLFLLALGIGLGSTAATPLGAFLVESSVAGGLRVETAGLLLASGSAASIAVRVLFGRIADGMSGGLLVAAMLATGVAGSPCSPLVRRP